MKYKTDDVFGDKSTLVLSYVERDLVDARFKAALKSSNKVVVYGSSKQGKMVKLMVKANGVRAHFRLIFVENVL